MKSERGSERGSGPLAPVTVVPTILLAIDKDGKELTSEMVRVDPRIKPNKHR